MARCKTCGHMDVDHIHCEGACRPGFKCFANCSKFVAEEELETPPLGIVPLFIIREHRMKEIVAAMSRYLEAKKEIPLEWIKELERWSEHEKKG